jgi:hypothetical protein
VTKLGSSGSVLPFRVADADQVGVCVERVERELPPAANASP